MTSALFDRGIYLPSLTFKTIRHNCVAKRNCCRLPIRGSSTKFSFISGRLSEGSIQKVPLLPNCKQSIPKRVFFSLICLDFTDARVSIGGNPEFSANAIGMVSRAFAKARMAYCSIPGVFYYLSNCSHWMLPCPLLPQQRESKQSPPRHHHKQRDYPLQGFSRHRASHEVPV